MVGLIATHRCQHISDLYQKSQSKMLKWNSQKTANKGSLLESVGSLCLLKKLKWALHCAWPQMWSSTFTGVETFKLCASLSALKAIVRGKKMCTIFLVVQNKKGNREGKKEGRREEKKGRHFCHSTPQMCWCHATHHSPCAQHHHLSYKAIFFPGKNNQIYIAPHKLFEQCPSW